MKGRSLHVTPFFSRLEVNGQAIVHVIFFQSFLSTWLHFAFLLPFCLSSLLFSLRSDMSLYKVNSLGSFTVVVCANLAFNSQVCFACSSSGSDAYINLSSPRRM